MQMLHVVRWHKSKPVKIISSDRGKGSCRGDCNGCGCINVVVVVVLVVC